MRKIRLLPSKKFVFIYFNESPLKMMKNAFYFMLNALLVFDIFTFEKYWSYPTQNHAITNAYFLEGFG